MTSAHQELHQMNDTCIVCGTVLTAGRCDLFDTRFGIDRNYGAAYCPLCDDEQLVPIPDRSELIRLYETYYNYSGEHDTCYTRFRELFLSSFFYQRLWLRIDGDISFHGRKGGGRLLDVGCNEGRGLVTYRRNGFHVEGLELNEKAAATARDGGFNVYTQPIEQFDPPEPYDVVVLSNVLEHSLTPLDMLRHVNRILKPKGQVWISCPNDKSWLKYTFGKYWINWHVPFHILQFSEGSLKKLLERSGFSGIAVQHETPALWASHSFLAGLFSKKGRPNKQLRNPLLIMALLIAVRMFLFPVLWLGNRSGHGDCLVVTASKDAPCVS